MRVDVDVRGDRQAVELIQRLSKRLDDGQPQLLGLVDELNRAMAQRFRGIGVRWRRLDRETVRKDRAENRDPRTLVLTGRLMESLTRVGDREQVVQVRPGLLRFGTRVYYARFHHRGEGTPRRTVVGLARVQKQQVVSELRSLLLDDL